MHDCIFRALKFCFFRAIPTGLLEKITVMCKQFINDD
jgi:hypothetical protein